MSLLADSRIFVFGGFNGQDVYEDVHILDLAGSGYLAQVSPLDISACQCMLIHRYLRSQASTLILTNRKLKVIVPYGAYYFVFRTYIILIEQSPGGCGWVLHW